MSHTPSSRSPSAHSPPKSSPKAHSPRPHSPNAQSPKTSVKGIQVHSKSKLKGGKGKPCPWLCNLVPINVPAPGPAQTVLHPRKDVFVLKVAKVGPNGDRRCKMELELVTPKGPERKALCRIDTRETQCEPEPPPCCCMKAKKKRK